MSDFTFITGNQNKADHLKRLLGIEFTHKKVDLDEIQSASLNTVVEHKVRQAYELLHAPVLVDDVAMGFDALSGLPGPFIKFFVEAEDGLEQLCRICDGLASRRATAYATYGYYDGTEMHILTGKISGEIADHPRGEASYAYGWDAIFCPDDYNGRTRAELTQAEYDTVYEQIRPLAELRKFLAVS